MAEKKPGHGEDDQVDDQFLVQKAQVNHELAINRPQEGPHGQDRQEDPARQAES